MRGLFALARSSIPRHAAELIEKSEQTVTGATVRLGVGRNTLGRDKRLEVNGRR